MEEYEGLRASVHLYRAPCIGIEMPVELRPPIPTLNRAARTTHIGPIPIEPALASRKADTARVALNDT